MWYNARPYADKIIKNTKNEGGGMFIRDPNNITQLQAMSHQLPPMNILVCAENFYDGIGDFRNAIDAYRDIKKIAPNHHVKLMVACAADQLQQIITLATFVSPGSQCLTIDVSKLNTDHYSAVDMTKEDIIFFTYEDKNNRSVCAAAQDIIAHYPAIHEFIRHANFVLHVSLDVTDSVMVAFFDFLPDNCSIYSVVEYSLRSGVVTDLYPGTIPLKFSLYGDNPIKQVGMGIRSESSNFISANEVGLKLNSTIYEGSDGCPSNNKAALLGMLSPTILAAIMGAPNHQVITEEMIKSYVNNKLLAVASIKGASSGCHLAYALLGLAQSKNAHHIDLVMMPESRAAYWRYDLSGLTVIVKPQDSDKIETFGTGNITLRVIAPTNMINPRDMEVLFMASDMVAASGDNAVSDMLSSKKIPFIAPLGFKEAFVKSIIDYMSSVGCDVLAGYYRLMMTLCGVPVSLLEQADITTQGQCLRKYMADNAEKIGIEAGKFAASLFANKSIEPYFTGMLNEVFVKQQQKLVLTKQTVTTPSAAGFFSSAQNDAGIQHYAAEESAGVAKRVANA